MKTKKTSNNPAKGVVWDLSSLYKSITDPKVENDKKKIKDFVQKFAHKYKGKISSLTPDKILGAIKEYEKIIDLQLNIELYSSLLFAKDSNDQEIKVFNQSNEEFINEITSQLLWFEIEIIEINEKQYKTIIEDKNIQKYKYYLDEVRKYKPHTLSEKEEVLLTKKSQSGKSAFVRFFDEKTNYLRFPLKVKGKVEQLTLPQLMPYLSHTPDRQLRIKASKSFTEVFKENQHFYTFVLNTLLLDKKISDEIRGYKYPQESTFLIYDVSPEIIKLMVKAVTTSTGIVEKYYRAKAKIQGIKKLQEWDRYSPLYESTNQKYSWLEAKDVIMTAFEKAHPSLKNIVSDFYENKWIDAELSPYKTHGAFCAYGGKSINPFILCNYSGELQEVTTLAHELGHGVHGYLSNRNNPALLTRPSTATAEIASIFAESMTFDLLVNDLVNNNVKLSYLSNKIEGMFASIFRQTEFYLFESDIHNHRREIGELSSEDINNYYQKRLQHMFGKSLVLSDGHKYWWGYISHFYHFNFYVFTYAFGELLSISLYAKYQQEGKSFMDKYIEALKAGGSKSPVEITKMMGVDISSPTFWEDGLKLLDQYVDNFIQLAHLPK